MLMLGRKAHESIRLYHGDRMMRFTVLDVFGNKCALVFELPRDVVVVRSELMKRFDLAHKVKGSGRLIIRRKEREAVFLHVPGLEKPVYVSVNRINGNLVQLGFSGPLDVRIVREELEIGDAIRSVRKPAAASSDSPAH